MAGNVDVTIGCNYEDFLRGLANVKKEADLAVLEQRKKDQAEREARRAAQRQERAEQRAADREKEEASRQQKKNADLALREQIRQIKEKQKAEKEAQRAAQSAQQQKIDIAQGFLGGGITGGISSIGASLAGATGGLSMIAAELANKFIEGFQKAVQEAKELRNLSYATDISTGELRKMAVVAEQSGISLSQFAHSVAEFNKNMGRAKIGGSELNNLLNKLGVSQEDLKSNSYDYNRALRDLAKAHRAGTDAATLAYYGNLMFGSSFEQLLPIIKKGTGDFDRSMQGIYKTSELGTSVLADTSDRWDKFWSNFKNIAADGFAYLTLAANSLENARPLAAATLLAKGGDLGKSAEVIANQIVGGDEVKMLIGRQLAKGMSKVDSDAFMKRLEELVRGQSGVKLTPLGLQTAQGASSLQQMGGGDIVSAAAFSPAQATAEATQKTAENTYRTNELLQQYNNKSPIRNAPRR